MTTEYQQIADDLIVHARASAASVDTCRLMDRAAYAIEALIAETGWVVHDGVSAPNLLPSTVVQTRRAWGTMEDSPRINLTVGWWDDENDSNWVWPNGVPEAQHIIAYRVVTK